MSQVDRQEQLLHDEAETLVAAMTRPTMVGG